MTGEAHKTLRKAFGLILHCVFWALAFQACTGALW